MLTRWVLGHKITPQVVSGDFDMVIGETPALTQGPPPHFHKTYHEVFLVIEGEMAFMLDGKTMVLKEGQSINLQLNSVHSFSNNTNHLCKWVNVHSPKGFLSFFENLGIPDSEKDAVKRSVDPKVIQQVMETASQYDMNITL